MANQNLSTQLKNDPVSRGLVWLVQYIAKWIRRHPYISVSIVLHMIAVYFLVSYGAYEYKQYQLVQEKASIDASLQRLDQARKKEMQTRVDNIEKMKQLLDQTLPEDERENLDENQSQAGKNKSPDLNESETTSDLLARAKSLSKAIQKVSQEIQAEDMARLLNMPKEEAIKKVEEKIAKEQKQLEKEPQEKKSSSQNQDLAKANDEIKRIETEAKKVLEKRKQQLDSANNGFKIHPVSAETDPNQQSENSLSKNKSKNKNSSGGGRGASDGNPISSNEAEEAASKRIEEFLAADTGKEQLAFSGSDISRIPVAERATHKTMGRNFGVGGEFSDRVYLNCWYVIGPFLGRAGAKLFDNPSYPPEDLVDLDAVYIGKDNRILKWQYVFAKDYPFVPPDPVTEAIYYGYNEIKFDQAIDLWGWFGSDDDLQVWINGRLAWAGGDINKQALYDISYNMGNSYWNTWNLTDGKRKIHFEKGINKVLFKLSNGPNPKGVFASIVLTKD